MPPDLDPALRVLGSLLLLAAGGAWIGYAAAHLRARSAARRRAFLVEQPAIVVERTHTHPTEGPVTSTYHLVLTGPVPLTTLVPILTALHAGVSTLPLFVPATLHEIARRPVPPPVAGPPTDPIEALDRLRRSDRPERRGRRDYH